MKKSFKRVAALALALCLMMIGMFGANAQVMPNVVLSANLKAETSGHSVQVDLSTSMIVGAVSGEIVFAESDAAYVSAVLSEEAAKQNTVADSVLVKEGRIRFTLLGNVANGIKGNLATFAFTPAKGLQNVAFKLENVVALDVYGSPIDVPGTGTTATIPEQSISSVKIEGTAAVGKELKAVVDPTDIRVAYQWYADGVLLPLKTGAKFTPTEAEAGKVISVKVTSLDDYRLQEVSSQSVKIPGTVKTTAATTTTAAGKAPQTGENSLLGFGLGALLLSGVAACLLVLMRKNKAAADGCDR